MRSSRRFFHDKRRILTISLLFAFLGVGGGAWLVQVHERNKEIARHISIMMDRKQDWNIRKQAQEELVRFGKAAVFELIKHLDYDHSDPFDYERAYMACETFFRIGVLAKSAAPSLIPLLEDHDDAHVMSGEYISGSAARALGKIGKPSIPALIPVLKHEDWRTRAVALYAFEIMGPDASEATSSLLPMLDDPNPNVRRQAVGALGKVGSNNPETVPALAELLLQKDMRVFALMALIDIGSKAEKAKPVLTTLLDAEEMTVRAEMNVRFKAAHALWLIENGDEYNVTKLIETLEDGDTPFRMFAADTLGGLGPKAKEALPSLIGALSDKDMWVRRYSAAALGKIGEKDRLVVAALIKTLKDSEPRVRRFAVYSLGKLGPVTPEVEPAIRNMLNDQDATVQWQAKEALKQFYDDKRDDMQHLFE